MAIPLKAGLIFLVGILNAYRFCQLYCTACNNIYTQFKTNGIYSNPAFMPFFLPVFHFCSFSFTLFSLQTCLLWLLLLSLFPESFLIFLNVYESSVSVAMPCSRFTVNLSYFTPQLYILSLYNSGIFILPVLRNKPSSLTSLMIFAIDKKITSSLSFKQSINFLSSVAFPLYVVSLPVDNFAFLFLNPFSSSLICCSITILCMVGLVFRCYISYP